jgi:4-hydroxybenzoate polyprenyltransferase/phosphoserine phosphatase
MNPMQPTTLLSPPPRVVTELVKETRQPPLCVDLDGTLVRTDTLWETAVAQLKAHPWKALMFPFWLLRGRAHLKQKLAEGVKLDCAALPYSPDFLEYLKREHAAGRKLILVSACDRSVGEQVAEHLGIFSEIITSDGKTNLKSSAKARALTERFGARGFDYAGNEHADLAVWAEARERIAVNAPTALTDRLAKDAVPLINFPTKRPSLRSLVRALRCHQWCKNVLVFVPLITAHAYTNTNAVLGAAAMFMAWCFVASGIYVMNDLMDLDADRRHPTKCKRPFASGDLPVILGLAMGPSLLVLGCAISAAISPLSAVALIAYACVATGYSYHLKKRSLVDVFALAFLYTIRVVGGGIASGYPVTVWLLAFTSFLFLGLAFLKRCSELVRIQSMGRRHMGSRGYGVVDLPVLQMFGVASSFVAIVVFALYVNSTVAEAQYAWPGGLWAVAPCLLLWQCRLWLATARGEMHDDPIVYSIRDWVSWGAGACVLLVYAVATTGKTVWGF